MHTCTWRFRDEPCLEKVKLPTVLEFAETQGLERLPGVEEQELVGSFYKSAPWPSGTLLSDCGQYQGARAG